jgi:AcrR family transcriptional regulator
VVVGELEIHRVEYERSFTVSQQSLAGWRTMMLMAVNVRSLSDTRERIREAGLTLFNARGYTGTTVRELAEACDLTAGAIYNHYASKEALLFAIVDRVHDEADAVLSEALRSSAGDPVVQLEALAAAFTAFHVDRPRETRVANRDYIYLPEGQRDSVVRRRRRVRGLFADVLREGERRGSFSFGELGSEDAVQAASMAILNMVVFVGEWFDPRGPRSARDTAALHGRLALRIARSG